jgi:hypothetical protein
VARGAKLVGIVVGLLAAWWAWTRHLRDVWRQLVRGVGGEREDPVRREASRWLVRISEGGNPKPDFVAATSGRPETDRVVAELQRLRFGARSTWPEPEKTFRRARQVARATRRITRA